MLTIDVCEQMRSESVATYSVIKDSGDDPDITGGMEIFVTIKRRTRAMCAGKGASASALSLKTGLWERPASSP